MLSNNTSDMFEKPYVSVDRRKDKEHVELLLVGSNEIIRRNNHSSR